MVTIKNKLIPLTQGKVALVDEGDFDWLNQWKWYYHDGYAARSIYLGRYENGKKHVTTVKMHQAIMEARMIDHVDNDGLNNQRSNLRLCTATTNQQNRKVNYNKRFKGVSWHKRIGAWAVHIRVNKQLKHIGYYNDELYAAKVYNQMALMYFGKFARLNNV